MVGRRRGRATHDRRNRQVSPNPGIPTPKGIKLLDEVPNDWLTNTAYYRIDRSVRKK